LIFPTRVYSINLTIKKRFIALIINFEYSVNSLYKKGARIKKAFVLVILGFVWILYLPADILDIEKNYNVRDSYNDCILLFNGNNLFNTDINFGYISEFYGLSHRKVDLSIAPLVDSLLKNKNGNYIKSICAAYFNLSDTNLLDTQEINLIKNAINNGSNLIITEINDSCLINNIAILTDSLYRGAEFTVNNNGWYFTNSNDSITSAFANSEIIDNAFQEAYEIFADNDVRLITDTDDTITIFSYLEIGNGKIFLDGDIQDRNIGDYSMCELYNSNKLNNILPLMMFLRYSNGNQCWHNNQRYANLTIDDPYFIEPFGYLNFHELLNEMEEHDFHTTIAYMPRHFDDEQDTSVINLFKNYPERYSIIQHGNNHDGYEFICYTQEQLDTLNAIHNNVWSDQIPRPYIDQEDDIVEGYTRLCELHRNTEINFGKVMIFPWGISLSPTLELLKMYNFNATVNAQNEPYLFLGGDSANNYDYNMRLANMNFRNFPVVGRKHPCSSYDPINYRVDFWKYNLFLDKPLLMYSHHSQIFKYGIDKFNPVADSINQQYPDVEWKSLGFIVKKMYLEKNNYDGSVDVMFYGNDVIVSNETDIPHAYYLKKIENLNVPIYNVTVNGSPVGFTLIDSILQIEIDIPPHTEKEIRINYYSGDKDFTIIDSTIKIDTLTNVVDLKILNNGNTGGSCPIGVYSRVPGNDNLLYLSVAYIEPFNTAWLEITLPDTFDIGTHPFYIFLDPFNIILEREEDNNIYRFGFRVDLDIDNDTLDVVNNIIDFDSLPAGPAYISKSLLIVNTSDSLNPDYLDGPSIADVKRVYLESGILINGNDTLESPFLEGIPDSLSIGSSRELRLTLFIPEGKMKGDYSGYIKIQAVGEDSTVDTDSVYVIVRGPYPEETLEYFKVFPNPFRPDIGHEKVNFEGITENTTVIIYDIKGREVWRGKEDNTDGLITWNPAGIASGVYLYVVKNSSEIKRGKIAIIK